MECLHVSLLPFPVLTSLCYETLKNGGIMLADLGMGFFNILSIFGCVKCSIGSFS